MGRSSRVEGPQVLPEVTFALDDGPDAEACSGVGESNLRPSVAECWNEDAIVTSDRLTMVTVVVERWH